MSDELLSARDLALVDAVAERVLELLGERDSPTSSPPRLVDAAALARELGVARSYVYDHAEDLGARRLGDGARARLRFDVETARAAIARSGSERSAAPNANGDGPSEAPTATSRRRLPNRLAQAGSALPVGPAPRGRRRSGEQR